MRPFELASETQERPKVPGMIRPNLYGQVRGRSGVALFAHATRADFDDLIYTLLGHAGFHLCSSLS